MLIKKAKKQQKLERTNGKLTPVPMSDFIDDNYDYDNIHDEDVHDESNQDEILILIEKDDENVVNFSDESDDDET